MNRKFLTSMAVLLMGMSIDSQATGLLPEPDNSEKNKTIEQIQGEKVSSLEI